MWIKNWLKSVPSNIAELNDDNDISDENRDHQNDAGQGYQRSFVGRYRGRGRGRGRGYFNRTYRPAPILDYVDPSYSTGMNNLGFDISTAGVSYTDSQKYSFPLLDLIKNQIEYYFSEKNLLNDDYLRKQMDEQGYIPITIIASFRCVQELTNNIFLVIQAIESSDKLEYCSSTVKVRTKQDPLRWPILKNKDEEYVSFSNYQLQSVSGSYTSNLNPNAPEWIPNNENINK